MNITILGLSLTSSWGNGHATTYRNLIKELYKRGHKILFLERDIPWYASNRDLPAPDYCTVKLYNSIRELKNKYQYEITHSDMVIVGSYVPEGVEAGKFVCDNARGIKAFYDIDTPVTIARLEAKDDLYLSRELIPQYELYLSFTGGHTLSYLEKKFHSPMARPLYCSVDPDLYYPESIPAKWNMGYLGTFSKDRQSSLENFLIGVAGVFPEKKYIVAGPQYPEEILWPQNVERKNHIPPNKHRTFYNEQEFTLNLTRADMIKRGYSPSVRLFEAAACGTPIISDNWEGINDFFEPGIEILIAESKEDCIYYLQNMSSEERKRIGNNARRRVLNVHTAAHRALELELYAMELVSC